MDTLVGKHEPLLSTAKLQKLSWFGQSPDTTPSQIPCCKALWGGGAREDGAPEDKLARLRTAEDRQQPWWELCVNGIPRPSWLKDNGRKKTFTVMLSVY